MSVRDSFEAQFGTEQADAVMHAVEYHLESGITTQGNRGSDPFKWAIALAIGFECMSKDSYRKYHGVTAPWDEIDQWIKDHADLGSHDGDVDIIGAFAGVYEPYMEAK